MTYIAELKERVVVAEGRLADAVKENELLKSKLSSFWTGNVPDCATLDHMVLAKAGRQRLETLARKPALLTR